ncbi:MAG: hypothetical protein HY738_19540 [Bacteroidia bacterium]|nr:hypothetical protein [Bacteroidia bacterium]
MELIAKGKFYRNLANLNNRKLIKAVDETLKQMQNAKDILQIPNLVKMKKFEVHYRIKVAKDYRIGAIIRGNKVWLSCFGHRSNFYKRFP